MCAAHLTEWCRIPTSGARAVEPFNLDGISLLAIPQLAYDEPGQPAKCTAKWNERRNLRADMRADSLPANPFRITMRKVESFRLGPVQAKLVFMTPGSNMRVPACFDVRIHPNRRCRWPASSCGHSRRLLHQNVQLGLGFGVEKQDSRASAPPPDAIIQRFANFMAVLADSRENDALAAHADPLQVLKLPARYNVKTATELREMLENR